MYLHTVILGEQEANSVEEDCLAWTVNPEFFTSYLWGILSYERLRGNLTRDLTGKAVKRKEKIENGEKNSIPVRYTISGFWKAFIASSYVNFLYFINFIIN